MLILTENVHFTGFNAGPMASAFFQTPIQNPAFYHQNVSTQKVPIVKCTAFCMYLIPNKGTTTGNVPGLFFTSVLMHVLPLNCSCFDARLKKACFENLALCPAKMFFWSSSWCVCIRNEAACWKKAKHKKRCSLKEKGEI